MAVDLTPLTKIAEAAPGVLYVFELGADGSTRFPYTSSMVNWFFGLDSEELKADAAPAFAMIHPDDLPQILASIVESARAQSRWFQSFRVLHPERGTVWIEGHSSPAPQPDGSVLWYGYLSDVTTAKRMERELADSQARFSALFAADPIGKMLIRVSDRRVIEANPAMCRLLRAAPEDVIGQTSPALNWLAAPEHRDFFYRAVVDGPGVESVEAKVLRRDGTTAHALISALPIRIGGEACGLASVTDITARKEAEEGRAESEERFRQLAVSIREVFYLAELDCSRIIYVSPSYQEIWGRSCESLYASSLSWLEAIHPDDVERVRASLPQQTSGGYDVEYRVLRADGQVRWVRDRAFPVFDAEGRAVRVAGVAEDITDRRQLEQQLHQTQKLESIGQLAGGIAHDFNNLLTVISTSAEELLSALDPRDPVREAVEDIATAGERAAALTRQLLAFSRRELIDPKILDLNGVVTEVEKMLRRLLGEDVTLVTRLEPALPAIRIDHGHLVQVLINLAVNARDAMPTGGTLAISTRVREERGVRWVSLEIADTGCGMAPAVRERAFEPFFTTKGVGKGTGLGLSVVHGIVQQSAGQIWIDSEVGAGTTVSILLPALEGAPARPDELRRHNGRGTEHVLVVEDDEIVRKAAIKALTRHGYRVTSARDGVEALSELAHNPDVQLVLTDVVMPRMSGGELATRLVAERPEVRLLYTSGYADDLAINHGVLPAKVAFLPKPYTASDLVEKVREVLAG